MMNPQTTNTTEKEYEIIKELLNDVHRQVETLPDSGLTTWIADLEQQAGELCVHLKMYFDLEEGDGYLAPVMENRPQLAPALDALKEEHRAFLFQLNGLIQRFERNSIRDKTDLRSVCQGFQNFIAALRQHEKQESDLLQKTFSSDIGTHD